MAAVGRLSTLADGASAEANVGKVLGGEVMEPNKQDDHVEEESFGLVSTKEPEPAVKPAEPAGPPEILGQPAKWWEGKDSQGDDRKAWIDPRTDITPNMIVTADPNDPRLMTREARFWRFTDV